MALLVGRGVFCRGICIAKKEYLRFKHALFLLEGMRVSGLAACLIRLGAICWLKGLVACLLKGRISKLEHCKANQGWKGSRLKGLATCRY